MKDTVRVIVTGATGMVGEGVLHECLQSPAVTEVLVLGRRPCGVEHPKLREVVLPDLSDLAPVEDRLRGYDACFFCLGVSSVGMKEPEYTRLTHDLTLTIAGTLARLTPGMTFCYVSGAHTDSTEQGRVMWARVKGRTENALMRLPFGSVYNFRPPFMRPTRGLKNTLPIYRYIGWLYPIGRALSPGGFITLRELGLAMINAATKGYPKPIVEARDIVDLAWS